MSSGANKFRLGWYFLRLKSAIAFEEQNAPAIIYLFKGAIFK